MKQWKKVLAVALSVAMIFVGVDIGQIKMAYAGEDVTTITSFNTLAAEVANQEIAVGALETAVNLPSTLAVTTSVSGAAITVTPDVSINVTWALAGGATFDSSGEKTLVYTPVIDNTSYLIDSGLSLPQITVAVVSPTHVVASGTCGDTLTWTLTGVKGSYTLTISGTGAMTDYGDAVYSDHPSPWSSYAKQMKTLILGEEITYIGSNAFQGGTFTGNLVIPNSVKEISKSAFSECSAFTGTLTLPTQLETIGYKGFFECSGFSGSLLIPNTVTSIGNDAFSHCSGFNGSLTLSSQLTSIGENVFSYCSGFTGELTIPDGVESIGGYSFYNCSGFAKATIPDSVTVIYYGAFDGWNSNSEIDNYSDKYFVTTAKVNTYYKVTTDVNGTTTECDPVAAGALVGIPNPVKEGELFAGWYTDATYTSAWVSTTPITANLKLYAKFSPAVGQVACGASESDNLTMTLYGETGNYTLVISGTGAMANNLFSTEFLSSNQASIKTLVLNEGITRIGVNAFLNFSGLTGALTIPDSVLNIGDGAFASCRGLKGSLKLGSQVQEIGNNAFNSCGFTGKLTLPESVKTIGASAFISCSGFTGDLIIPDSVTSLGAEAFASCSGFDGILKLSSNIDKLESYVFYRCTNLKGTLLIPEGVKSIGDYAFIGCGSFNGSLILPEGLESIGITAFSGCVGFSKAVIPASINKDTGIGSDAFSGWASGSKIYNLSFYSMVMNNHYSSGTLGVTYTVTTYVDGAVTSTKKVVGDGGSMVSIADPVKAGYVFAGWYTEEAFTNVWTGNGGFVTADINLYAKMKKILAVSDISAVANSSTVTYDGTNKVIPVTFTLPGYAPNGGTATSETGTAMATVSSDGAGTYTSYTLSSIAFAKGESSKYMLTGLTDGSLNITNGVESSFGITLNKKLLTITAKHITLSVGDSMNTLNDKDVNFVGFAAAEDQSVLGGALTFISSPVNTNNEFINGTVTPQGYQSDNYEITYIPGALNITAKTFAGSPYNALGLNNGGTGVDRWYRGDITLEPDPTYCGNFSYIGISMDGGVTWSDFTTSVVIPAKTGDTANDTATGSVQVRLATGVDEATSAVVKLSDFSYQMDTTAQAGTITIGGNEFKDFLNSITFGLLFKDTITVSLAVDGTPADLSGGVTCYLYEDTSGYETSKTYEELANLGITSDVKKGWVKTNSYDVTADEKFVAYGKIVDGAGNITYLSSNGIIVDKTAPVISEYELQTDGIFDVSVILNLTANETGSYYYAVQESGETYPADAAVLEALANNGASAGCGTVAAATKTVINVSGLTANTEYAAFIVIKDLAGNYSLIHYIPFATSKTIPVITKEPTITGAYGQKISGMVLTPGVAKSGDTELLGTWSIASEEVPNVGTVKTYTVTFTPTSAAYAVVTTQVVPVVTAKNLTAEGVTISEIVGMYIYDSLAKEPTVTITDSKATIASTDYSISYNNNITVGTATLTVKGKGNYKGMISREFTINKASALVLTNITKDYVCTAGCSSESIELSDLLPSDRGTTTYTVGSLINTDGIVDATPVVSAAGSLNFSINQGAAGNTATIQVTVSMTNYENSTLKIIINLVNKTPISFSGVTLTNKTYDGNAVIVTGTLTTAKTGTTDNVSIEGLIYSYTSTDGNGYQSSNPPTNVGSYQLVISVPDSNTNYIGSSEPITFTIEKKTATVTFDSSSGSAVTPTVVPNILTKEELEASKEEGKTVSAAAKAADGTESIWTFAAEQLSNSTSELEDIDLSVSATPINNLPLGDALCQLVEEEESDGDDTQAMGIVLNFSHHGILPATAHIRIKVSADSDASGLIPGSKVFLYYYNEKNDKLEELATTEYTVDDEGYVTIDITHCSKYVLLPTQANSITALLDQVSVASKGTMYAGGNDNLGQMEVSYPSTLLSVKKFSENKDAAIKEVKFTYKSSNSKVVSVSSTGKLTAKKTGTATITITAQLEDGTMMTYTQKVKVKKADITFTKTVESMTVGEKATFTIDSKGYTISDITWSTSKSGIATVSTNKGKTSATITAKTTGMDYVVVKAVNATDKELTAKFKVVVTDK